MLLAQQHAIDAHRLNQVDLKYEDKIISTLELLFRTFLELKLSASMSNTIKISIHEFY